MNEQYNYENYNNSQEPDYYSMYKQNKAAEAKKAVSRCALALFIFIIASNAVAILAQIIIMLAIGPDAADNLFEQNIYINWLLGSAPMYLVGFPIFYLIIRTMKTFSLPKEKIKAGDFISLFFISEGIMFIGSLIGNTLNSFFSTLLGREISNTTEDLILNSPLWLIALIVVVIGPIIEELIFRKLLIDRLSRFGATFAIVISSVAFGLFHGNFYQFFYAAMLGFILGYIYVKTGNVKYSTGMHMLINFFGSFVPILLTEKLAEFEEFALALEAGEVIDMAAFLHALMIIASYSIVQYAIYFVGIAFLITYITQRKFKITKACEVNLPKERVLDVSFINVGSILFILASLAQFAISIFLV